MPKITLTCSYADIRHVRITCRCKHTTIHEFPRQVEQAQNFVLCPQCGQTYIIQRSSPTGPFDIRRYDNIANTIIYGA